MASRPSQRRWVFGAVVTVALGTACAHAALYRWVDDKGVVQYSDKPPDNKAKGGVEMSKRGVVLKKLDAAPSVEQQKAKQEDDARRKAAEQEALAQRRADNALLLSFSSAQEIDLKRDRELQSIGVVIANLRDQERSLVERLNEERRRVEVYEKKNQAAPASIAQDIARAEASLKTLRDTIAKRQEEMRTTREHYEALRKRYLALHQPEGGRGAVMPTADVVASPPGGP
jgi:hypothetical protein